MGKYSKLIKDTFVLFAITLVAGIALGVVYESTVDIIAARNEQAKMDAYKKVYSEAATFESNEVITAKANEAKDTILAENGFKNINVDEALVAVDTNGTKLGYVLSVTTGEGYNGNITISMGYSLDGTLKDIKILTISETAGLGLKARDAEFTNKFTNKQVESFTVTKAGATNDSEIDAISGATITSNAVVDAINAGILFVTQSAEAE